jgi:glutamate-ammonia-ligase adenylyltransferase
MNLTTNRDISQALEALPPILREKAAHGLDRLEAVDIAGVINAGQLMPLLRLLACSEFAGAVLRREFDWFTENLQALDQPPSGPALQGFADEIASHTDSQDVAQRRIRRFRNRYMLHLLWREYAGSATLDETLHGTSDLADALLRAAVGFAERQLEERFGLVRNAAGDPVQLVVLGMGKLGGRELNLSSDIDLIFLYPGGKDSDGRKSLSPQEFFTRICRTVITLLEAPTADGFAFRVDTRLRPFGDSGPPVSSFAALETYLLQHGRGWERYAYVKARVVGPVPPVDVLTELDDNMIAPFVYRRYLDFGVFESLREMHALISAEVQRRELADNIKLGPGGIREIEFIVQSLQLVRGGGQSELRGRELQKILPQLAGRHGLSSTDVSALHAAYIFLRRTENFIQAMRDQQTHELPSNPIDQARLAVAMGFTDWPEFAPVLQQHREIVARNFEKIAFRERAIEVDTDLTQKTRELWERGAAESSWAAALDEAGYADATELADKIVRFKATAAYADATASRRLSQFVPKLFVLLGQVEFPAIALRRVLEVAAKVLRRSAYIALLNENDAAMTKLVDLCSRSAYVTNQIAQSPALLDELLDPGSYADQLSRADMARELTARAASVSEDDSEAQMEMLVGFQRASQFRIALADYEETLPIMRVSDCLTELAETVLQYALQIAWHDLLQKHGAPDAAGFAIIAYGKFGGLELSYGSDLDLVFLHDSAAPGAMTNGAKPLEYTMFFTRLVRRLVHILTTRTASGALYEVDTRLRPDGNSGLLVSNIEAFERYQEENAWTWEHQALLRARAVAGSQTIASQFDAIRRATLMAGLHLDTLRNDVVTMRARMRSSLDKSDAERFDLKQGKGGIGDIEFLVQYLVLANAADHPAVIEFTDNIRQLDALATEGLLDFADATRLQECYRTYRHRAHHLSLNELPTYASASEFLAERQYVGQLWDSHLGGPDA